MTRGKSGCRAASEPVDDGGHGPPVAVLDAIARDMPAAAYHMPPPRPDLAHHPVARGENPAVDAAPEPRAPSAQDASRSIMTRSATRPGRIAPQSAPEGARPPGERPGVERRADRRPGSREDVARPVREALAVLEPAQLLAHGDPDVRVGPDAEAARRRRVGGAREDAVAEVGLGDRAEAGDGARWREPRGSRRRSSACSGQAPARVDAQAVEQERDRAGAEPGLDLLDLPHLLGGVDVHRVRRVPRRRERRARRASVARSECGAMPTTPSSGKAGARAARQARGSRRGRCRIGAARRRAAAPPEPP